MTDNGDVSPAMGTHLDQGVAMFVDAVRQGQYEAFQAIPETLSEAYKEDPELAFIQALTTTTALCCALIELGKTHATE